MTRIALATSSALPTLPTDDRDVVSALDARGASVESVAWDDPSARWADYDLVVIRSTWDYAQRRGDFLRWAAEVESVTRLANPYRVVEWNTDKRYLTALEDEGVAVVPTMWLEPERHLSSRALHTRFPASGDFVLKPSISAGSIDTGRYTAMNADSRGLAIQHARRLLADDRTVMLQRYLTSVDTVGERAHAFIAGEYSHSVLKGAMLDGPDVGVDGVYKPEQMSSYSAASEEIDVAREVVAVAHRLLSEAGAVDGDTQPFLYARVDMVSGDDGAPVLMELELVEPSLFTSLAEGALDRFADAIMTWVS